MGSPSGSKIVKNFIRVLGKGQEVIEKKSLFFNLVSMSEIFFE